MVVRARRIRSEKLREHQYKEGFARSFEGKRIEWNGDNNVKHKWEEVKTGKGRKCKRSVWLSESWRKEPKESVVKR